MAVKKPLGGVASLAIKRGSNNRVLTATWKVPSSLSKGTKKADKADKLTVTWTLAIPGKDPKKVEIIKKLSDHNSAVNLSNFSAGKKHYTRSSFYPLTKRKLSAVTCKVLASNKGGSSPKEPSTTYKFKLPKPPTVGAFSMNADTGKVTATITAAADAGQFERYDTEYQFTVVRSDTGATLKSQSGTFTGASQAISYDLSYQGLPAGAYVRFYAKARSRGYAGDGAWAEREFYVARPNVPVIASKDKTLPAIDVPSKAAQDRVTVNVKLNKGITTDKQNKQHVTHPITQVSLEALPDVAYATREQVEAASDRWEEVGAPDNGSCTALSCLVSDVMPSAGNHSWVRVKAWYLV